MASKKDENDTRAQMLTVNEQQKVYYESRFDANTSHASSEEAANSATNAWTRMRRGLLRLRANAGTDARLEALHRRWLEEELPRARVLDLGCFSGNPLSFWIAERAADYTGVDLSEQAIEALNASLQAAHLSDHARGYALDFLNNGFPDQAFDVVYARSVLHHFRDIRVVLTEIARVLAPGGVVITFDPLATEPVNRLVRTLYRPFQSDRAWEWPFTQASLRAIQAAFTIEDSCGYDGMSKLAYPFVALPVTQGLGQRVNRYATAFDARHTHQPGLALSLCWGVTFKLRHKG